MTETENCKDKCDYHKTFYHIITENKKNINAIGEKFNKEMYGNGNVGLKTKISNLQYQLAILMLMNVGIYGLLIKLIFFNK